MPHECTDCGRAFEDGSKAMLSGCPDCGGNTFQFRPASPRDAPSGGSAPAPETASAGGTAARDTADDGGEVAAADTGASTPPAGADGSSDGATAGPPSPSEPPLDSTVARTVGSAANTVRNLVSRGSREPPEKAERPEPAAGSADRDEDANVDEPAVHAGTADAEDAAQASARSEVVSPTDLPTAPDRPRMVPDGSASTTASRSTPCSSRTASNTGPEASPTVVPDQAGSTSEPQSKSAGGTDEPPERPDLEDLREELNQQFESIKVLEPGQYELNLMELYDRQEYIIALQEDGKYTIQVPERWND